MNPISSLALAALAATAVGCSSHPTSSRLPVGGVPPSHVAVDGVTGAHSVVARPATPVHGRTTHVAVTGRAPAGQELILTSVDYGDGQSLNRAPAIDCASPIRQPALTSQRFAGELSHTWSDAGTFLVHASFVGLCAHGVPPRPVSFRLVVR